MIEGLNGGEVHMSFKISLLCLLSLVGNFFLVLSVVSIIF